ncbi:MAG: hypothetical protein ACYDAY_11075 [Candidatus Dormibacteria bacterium]
MTKQHPITFDALSDALTSPDPEPDRPVISGPGPPSGSPGILAGENRPCLFALLLDADLRPTGRLEMARGPLPVALLRSAAVVTAVASAGARAFLLITNRESGEPSLRDLHRAHPD